MKESILRDKLKEFQLFIMENRYSRGLVHDSKNDEDRKKGEAILKDFFIGMVEGKPITKAIEILEYIKEHKWEKTKFKNGDNEERFGVWQYGENFFKWSDLVIDYLVDSFEDVAENLGGSSLVTKEQNKQPQQLEQPQDDGVCPADSDVSSGCVVSPENGKVQSKQPQQLEQPQDDGVCPDDSDVTSVGGVSPDNGKEQSKQPQQQEQPQKKRGRSFKSFSDCILIENKDGLLDKLHTILDGRKGKFVYLVLNTLLYEGVLKSYTHTQITKEFGDIGSDSAKTRYRGTKNGKLSCISAFTPDEINGVRKIFSEFLK